MTPPIFNLGDEVETKDGSRFKISQIKMDQDGSVLYSTFAYPYYHASELRLVNEKPLSPMQVTCTYDPVDCECRAIQVSCPCGRKAEIALPEKSEWKEVPDGLKIGDWVKVIGPDVALNDYYRGRRFRISQTPCQMSDMFSCEFYPNYFPAKSLRKLTPEEIAQHTGTGYKTQEIRDEVESAVDAIRNLLAPDVYERLSAIEKRQDIQGDRLNTIDLEKDDLRKRLAFVEKFQRDQDDFVGRAIRDGVVEIWRKA